MRTGKLETVRNVFFSWHKVNAAGDLHINSPCGNKGICLNEKGDEVRIISGQAFDQRSVQSDKIPTLQSACDLKLWALKVMRALAGMQRAMSGQAFDQTGLQSDKILTLQRMCDLKL